VYGKHTVPLLLSGSVTLYRFLPMPQQGTSSAESLTLITYVDSGGNRRASWAWTLWKAFASWGPSFRHPEH